MILENITFLLYFSSEVFYQFYSNFPFENGILILIMTFLCAFLLYSSTWPLLSIHSLTHSLTQALRQQTHILPLFVCVCVDFFFFFFFFPIFYSTKNKKFSIFVWAYSPITNFAFHLSDVIFMCEKLEFTDSPLLIGSIESKYLNTITLKGKRRRRSKNIQNTHT